MTKPVKMSVQMIAEYDAKVQDMHENDVIIPKTVMEWVAQQNRNVIPMVMRVTTL